MLPVLFVVFACMGNAVKNRSMSDESIMLTIDIKQKLLAAKCPVWKKVLWWTLGGVLIFLGAVGVFYLLKRKPPAKAVADTFQSIKYEIAKNDLDAKIKIAEAVSVEKEVIEKLKEIKEISDETKRLEELNKLL